MFELYDLFFVQYLMMALAKIRKEDKANPGQAGSGVVSVCEVLVRVWIFLGSSSSGFSLLMLRFFLSGLHGVLFQSL